MTFAVVPAAHSANFLSASDRANTILINIEGRLIRSGRLGLGVSIKYKSMAAQCHSASGEILTNLIRSLRLAPTLALHTSVALSASRAWTLLNNHRAFVQCTYN